jgi:hypothetical protein
MLQCVLWYNECVCYTVYCSKTNASVTLCKQMYLSVCYSVYCGITNVSVTLCIVVKQKYLSVCYNVYCSRTNVPVCLLQSVL